MATPNEFGEERALCSETLELLKANDPRLTNLAVSWETEREVETSENSEGDTEQYCSIWEFDFAHRVDWCTAGPLLAANTHLKKLSITDYTWMGIEHSDSTTRNRCIAAWAAFCDAISRNQSIEHLCINQITSVVAHTLIESLSPLLMENNNLRRLELDEVLNSSTSGSFKENLSVLASALKQCAGNSSLEELRICDVKAGGYSPWDKSEVDDETYMCKLVAALKGHHNLATLKLEATNIGSGGCQALGGLCNISELSLSGNCMLDDKGIGILAKSLANSPTVQSLDLSYSRYVTSSGWQAFFVALQASNTTLARLNLRESEIDDDALVAFATWLEETRNLTYLNLGSNKAITSRGWLALIPLLKNQPLEELEANCTSIDDDGVTCLVRMLPNTLKRLYMNTNDAISASGWQSLAGLLRNRSMQLEELSMGEVEDDDTLVTVFSALAGNETLSWLGVWLECETPHGPARATLATRTGQLLTNALCDTSSIEATFSSNHTLRDVLPVCFIHPKTLNSLLEMNENPNKSEVARRKILQHHFSGDRLDANFELFLGMGTSELPHAMAWMGRDDDGLPLMYHLIRSMPSLVGHKGCKMTGAKRDREE